MGFDLQAHQELRRLSYQVNCLVRDFCCRAKRCFGISENGNPNLVLNQQGDWITAGGGASTIIEITKTNLLDLIQNNLVENAKYKITGVTGFTGIYVNGISPNIIESEGIGQLIVPEYNASGSNLGQLDASSIPSVGVNEKVIWADHYWVNTTGSPVTPTIIDSNTLNLTLIPKSNISEYETIPVEVGINTSLVVTKITNLANNNYYTLPAAFSSFFGLVYIYSPFNNSAVANCNLNIFKNYIGNIAQFKVAADFKSNSSILTGICNANKGHLQGCSISGENDNEFNNNVGHFVSVELKNGCRFNSNTVTGNTSSGGSKPAIAYIELFHNCEVIGNECNGDSSVIWDLRTGENCKFNNNIINSNAITSTSCGFSDIDQMQFDEVVNNELNGDDIIIEVINQLGYSKFNNNTFNGNYTSAIRWSGFQMLRSEIIDNTFNADNIIWKDIWLTDAKLRNATDIEVQNCTFENIDLDLTGFTNNIIGETIQSGKGWFTVTYNFSANPLTVGNPVSLNIIPANWRITDIKAIGSITGGAGAVLDLGLESDDESLLTDTVGNYSIGKTFTGFSAKAIFNRGLNLKSSVANIIGGKINILVEFTV